MHASYHNHTRWSDGKATVAEVIEAARAQGLDEVGISDHWVFDPQGPKRRWAMDPDRLGAYVEDVRAAAAASPSPIVRLGLEVDWFPDRAAEITRRLGEHAFDYLIGSVHQVGAFRYDTSTEDWEILSVAQRDEKHRQYWRTIADMARSGLFDIVAHMDLPKKFRQAPVADIRAEVDAALDAIAASGMTVELNTSGWFKPCEDAYPSEDLLRRCRSRDISAVLSADAHQPQRLVREFDQGAARLRAAGYTELVRFEGRRRRTVTL